MKQENTMDSSLSLLDDTNSSIDISEDHSLKIPNCSSSILLLSNEVSLEAQETQDTEHASNYSSYNMHAHGDAVDDDRFLSNDKGEDCENSRFENDSNHYHSPISTDDNEHHSSEELFNSIDYNNKEEQEEEEEEEEELSQDDFEECEEELSEVVDDDSDIDNTIITNDDILDSYEEYEKEQDEFHREMNRTKIAFAAYRNAVLHLVHHQDYKTKRPFTEEHDDLQNVKDDERMAKLEELAKSMVETKAKACVDAVLVANEFVERREARRERCKLLIETIDGKSSLFTELLKRSKKYKHHVIDVNENICNGSKSKKYFRCNRNIGRHVDCILSTFPKFEFQRDENDISSTNVEEGHSPARYKTSIWIGNMVEWRKQRNEYKESCYRKCSCPDCQNDLNVLLKHTKNS